MKPAFRWFHTYAKYFPLCASAQYKCLLCISAVCFIHSKDIIKISFRPQLKP